MTSVASLVAEGQGRVLRGPRGLLPSCQSESSRIEGRFFFFLFQRLFEIKNKSTRGRAGDQELPAKQLSPWFCRGLEPFSFRVVFGASRGFWRLEPVTSGGGGVGQGEESRASPSGAARPGVDA